MFIVIEYVYEGFIGMKLKKKNFENKESEIIKMFFFFIVGMGF